MTQPAPQPDAPPDRPIGILVIAHDLAAAERLAATLAATLDASDGDRTVRCASFADALADADACASEEIVLVDASLDADGTKLAALLADGRAGRHAIALVNAAAPLPDNDAVDYLPAEGMTSQLLERSVARAVARMRRERERAGHDERTRRSIRQFRALWDSALDAIMLVDAHGFVADANPALLALSGYDASEVIGCPFTTFFPQERHEQALGSYRRIFSSSDVQPFYEFPFRRKDGQERIVEGHVIFIEESAERQAMLAMVRDVTERKRIERALQESEEHFRLLIENALDVITVLEPDGMIRYESPSLERVLGYRPEELVGQNAFTYMHPEDLERVLEIFLDATRVPGTSAGAEFRFLHSSGEYIYLESIGTNLIEHPVIRGIVLNSRDVTGRKRAEQALREAHDKLEQRVKERTAEIVEMMGRLEQAHRTQQRFVADASHDLRTPLTVIAIEIDLLRETPGYDEETYEALARIKAEVGQMADLANDLLLLTMLDDPKPHDTRKDARLDAMIEEEIRQLNALAMEKKVTWRIDVGAEITCRCDNHAMRRALANVLENAVKYSFEGGMVEVSLLRDGERAIITVKDEGMGIDPEDHEKVFERFYRSDTTRSTPGTGLGLSIVKAVMDSHGGAARLESAPGAGTTMTIVLPL